MDLKRFYFSWTRTGESNHALDPIYEREEGRENQEERGSKGNQEKKRRRSEKETRGGKRAKEGIERKGNSRSGKERPG